MKICENCGQSFENHKRPNQRFCGIVCRDVVRTHRVEIPCSWCGTIVERHRYRAGKSEQTYCCKECERNWKRNHSGISSLPLGYLETGTVCCDHCGASIHRYPSALYLRNFCNAECRDVWQRTSGYMDGKNSPTWRGGHTDYRGPNWERQRRKALQRDNNICQHCGATDNLQVHHVKPYQLFATYQDANDLLNLLTLCMVCHTTADWAYRRAHPEIDRLLPDTHRIHVCQECGESFEAKGPNARRCENCWQRTCEACGKQFRPHLWHETNKFCSRECAGTSKRVLSE